MLDYVDYMISILNHLTDESASGIAKPITETEDSLLKKISERMELMPF